MDRDNQEVWGSDIDLVLDSVDHLFSNIKIAIWDDLGRYVVRCDCDGSLKLAVELVWSDIDTWLNDIVQPKLAFLGQSTLVEDQLSILEPLLEPLASALQVSDRYRMNNHNQPDYEFVRTMARLDIWHNWSDEAINSMWTAIANERYQVELGWEPPPGHQLLHYLAHTVYACTFYLVRQVVEHSKTAIANGMSWENAETVLQVFASLRSFTSKIMPGPLRRLKHASDAGQDFLPTVTTAYYKHQYIRDLVYAYNADKIHRKGEELGDDSDE